MLVKNKAVLFAAALTSLISTTMAAQAVILQISATGLVLRTTAVTTDEPGNEQAGLLTDTSGRYFGAVMFPTTDERVCSFAVIFRDNDANNITARLMKKPFTFGTNTAFDPPVTMAQVSSAGGNQNTRRAMTTAIAQPLINTAQAFYYVELIVPEGANIEVFGFQINVRPTCA